MINNNNQNQNNGDNSVNLQAQGNITNNYTENNYHYGITKENVKSELLQLFIENMPILRKIALDVANERAEQLNNSFISQISKLEKDMDKIYQRVSEPDVQMAIFEAQKNYAKYGDEDKLEQFVKLLIDKSLEECSTLKNILLDEAITTVAKITKSQTDFLSYLVYKQCFYADAKSIPELYEKHIKKFLSFAHVLTNITHFDIGFMTQLNCIEASKFRIVDDNIIDIIIKQYGSRFGTNDVIKRELYQIDSDLIDLIKKDEDYPTFYLTQVGGLIGTKNIEIKTGDVLYWNYN